MSKLKTIVGMVAYPLGLDATGYKVTSILGDDVYYAVVRDGTTREYNGFIPRYDWDRWLNSFLNMVVVYPSHEDDLEE